jgi:hypothetical protein
VPALPSAPLPLLVTVLLVIVGIDARSSVYTACVRLPVNVPVWMVGLDTLRT